MKFVKNIYPRRLFLAADCSERSVTAVVAEANGDGTFHIVGAGESPARGLENGDIRHLGDAVESVSEALRKAERSSGIRTEMVYFNFNDPQMESIRTSGFKVLMGEGEIQPSDVEEACRTAERLVSHFEKSILYSRKIGAVIDEHDFVLDPVGVFGAKLEVRTHILQARSDRCEAWQKLMKRCFAGKAVPVLSAWSTAYGVLPPEDRRSKKLIWDAGDDFLTAFVFENGAITDHRIFLTSSVSDLEGAGGRIASVSKQILETEPGIEQIFLTGYLSGDETNLESLRNQVQLPVRAVAPWGVPKLHHARYASAAGLLRVAEELEKKTPILQNRHGILMNVKERALSFINEYF